jgi:hypothetical protein
MKMSRKNILEPTETIGTDAPNDHQGEVNAADASEFQDGNADLAAAAEPPDGAETEPLGRSAVVYCGPNIPKGNLLSMAVFRGGLPGNVQRLKEKIPEIGGLIVPVGQLADTKKKIEIQGTEENRLNQVILAAREGI